MNIKLFKLGGNVLNTYRESVKGNEAISKPQARRKLTRNINLALKGEDKGNGCQYYMYGSLHMLVKGDKVIWIKNRCPFPKGWVKDMEKYNELNIKYGIEIDNVINESEAV